MALSTRADRALIGVHGELASEFNKSGDKTILLVASDRIGYETFPVLNRSGLDIQIVVHAMLSRLDRVLALGR